MQNVKTKRYLYALVACLLCFTAALALCACDDSEKNGGQTSATEFYVDFNGVKIELGKKAEDVLSKLGDAKYIDNLGDCGGIGVQMKYTYDNISVNTIKEKNGEVIHKMAFLNDLVSTPKGISIGSSEADVKKAYGEPSSSANGKLTYKSGDLEIEFTVKNGSVSSVNYRRIR